VLNLFRAEWIKIVGNRWGTSFLIWIFPVGILAFMVIMAPLVAFVPSMREGDKTSLGLDQALWTEQAIEIWSLPNSLFGRLMILGFTSIVFAGEYQWQTWQNVIPRSRRVWLILVKFLAMSSAAIFAFMLMSIIFAVGWGALVKIAGGTYGPALTGETLAEFMPDYLRQIWLALTLTLISANFAALAGMLTRSILGGVLIGALFTYIEGLSIVGMVLIANLVDRPEIVHLYRLTPSYNVANARSWITNHHATNIQGINLLGDIVDFSDSLNFSVIALLLWVIGLVTLTAYLFHRQDLT
jgi:hypothetical protein